MTVAAVVVAAAADDDAAPDGRLAEGRVWRHAAGAGHSALGRRRAHGGAGQRGRGGGGVQVDAAPGWSSGAGI